MDLKFSFGGASPDHHDHGGAPSGIPLPLSTAPASSSGVLEAQVRLEGDSVVAEAISGDGVTYARAEVATSAEAVGGQDPAGLARAARSALARAVAELEGPLAESVTAVILDLGAAGAEVLAELGIDAATPVIGAALQSRVGIAEGTPIRLAG